MNLIHKNLIYENFHLIFTFKSNISLEYKICGIIYNVKEAYIQSLDKICKFKLLFFLE